VSRKYFDATYEIDDLRATSVYEQLLASRGLIAPTFVVFDFGTNYPTPKIGVSVETRREVGEHYSLIKGALRGFELTHPWASERDLVERRVKYLGYSSSQYPVAQKLPNQMRYLENFLLQTAALSREPRWYNTLTSNCTNVIIETANQISPGFLPFDKSFVLTGLADDYLISRGVVASSAPTIVSLSNIESFLESLEPY
jgi:hypothetical protein